MVNISPGNRGTCERVSKHSAVGNQHQGNIRRKDNDQRRLPLDDPECLGDNKHHHKPKEEHGPHTISRIDRHHRAMKGHINLQRRDPHDIRMPASARQRKLRQQHERIEETKQMACCALDRVEPERVNYSPGDEIAVDIGDHLCALFRQFRLMAKEHATPEVKQDQDHHKHDDHGTLRRHNGNKLGQSVVKKRRLHNVQYDKHRIDHEKLQIYLADPPLRQGGLLFQPGDQPPY